MRDTYAVFLVFLIQITANIWIVLIPLIVDDQMINMLIRLDVTHKIK